jgi:hypothetical protein
MPTALSANTKTGDNLRVSCFMRSFALMTTVVLFLLPIATLAQMMNAEKHDLGHHPSLAAAGAPVHCLAAHRIGRIKLAIANNGTFGREYHPGGSIDWFTGEGIMHSCEYPKGSDISYLFGGAFWIGAVVGHDTLVSVGADGWQQAYEMFPDEADFGKMIHRSINDADDPEHDLAVSEEDYIAVYTDTMTAGVADDYFGRSHQPLNIEVTQASYAWSYEYAEDFVLFDYKIKNIGERTLREVFMAIYVDCMVCYDCLGTMQGFTDDHSGFLLSYPDSCGACEWEDTVYTAFAADDDGDYELLYSDGRTHPTPALTATRIVRTPAESLDVSFNWWIGNGIPALDFSPREKSGVGRLKEDYRDFRTGGLGTPEGDRNKYYVMSNREFDYDQVRTGTITPFDSLWMYPNQNLADTFAVGYDTRYLLSFGPFEIRPGQTLPISLAYIAGDSVHRVLGNNANLPDDPDTYLSNLDFSDLALNSRWASWVYDNPGVDTDGDGYAGEITTCVAESSVALIDTNIDGRDTTVTIVTYGSIDTCWIKGDGAPDFRGAAPPPAPIFEVKATVGQLRVIFNGLLSETTRDVFSRRIDFEGYNIYLGRDEREESFSLVASYDIQNYDKLVLNANHRPLPAFELREAPFSLEELRCLYGGGEDPCQDNDFAPLRYSAQAPFVHPEFSDSIFYFEARGYNAHRPGIDTPIRKIYPNQPYPGTLDPELADPAELTETGRLKYFEYECVIDNLLASIPYSVSVTAFDYGSPESGLAALETSVTNGAMTVYAMPSSDAVEAGGLDVFVYPNPYRIDANYRDNGYEGRTGSPRVDYTRAVHFTNLPERCTIRIFTLDGDLVRVIDHDGGAHDSWNLITRNTQLVVAGLYYWSVESESGRTQIGKLAVIM